MEALEQAGYAADAQGREFVAIVTVEQRDGAVSDISAYDVTHAVSGRQKRSAQADSIRTSSNGVQADTKSQGVYPIKHSTTISIADLIVAVKDTYQSILSDDVLANFGEVKDASGHYHTRAKYSYAGENAANADLEALEQAGYAADDEGRLIWNDISERYSMDETEEVGALRLPSHSKVTEEEIREGIHTVARMEPVAEITGQEFAKSEIDLITQVERFFDSKGNRAYNSQIGEVTLERKGAKSDIAHGIGRKKAAAFAAVPDVIQSGSVVFYQNDWKGRGYDRAIIAAPIRMGNEFYFEAVVLNRANGQNEFYLHEVRAEKDGAQPFKTGTREGYPSGNAPSIPSILDHLWKVKKQSKNERYALDDEGDGTDNRIYPGMDDATRAEVLRKKEIRVPAYNSKDPVNGATILQLKNKYASEANQILRTLARNCGVVDRWYYNADVELDFRYSMNSVRESINKQATRGGGAEDFGKMLTVLPEVCDGAVEIEAHADKYAGTMRMDPNLKMVHVLLGAFSDGDTIIPVQLEIKENKPETKIDNKLYVTVTVKNEAGISSRTNAASWASTNTRNTPASVLSIADVMRGVKDESGDLVKYFPDSMLDSIQLQAKNNAIQKDNARLEDMRY